MPSSNSDSPQSSMPSLSTFRTALQAFASSPSPFRILHTIPIPIPTSKSYPTPHILYVLDSSFNPPTLAHLHIATTAILQDPHAQSQAQKRLLLLLATQNADKAPKPASYEQRLMMMTAFAQDLLQRLEEGGTLEQEEKVIVDVGVTKKPYFLDKAAAIAQSGVYGVEGTREEVEQVHLIGFDTLIRLLDPKYYPPDYTLQPLDGLFKKHRLRVTYRLGEEYGGKEGQRGYLEALREGKRETEGGRREWAGGIELVEGRGEGEKIISSTRVREAAREEDRAMMEELVTRRVEEWTLKEGLYLEHDEMV